ncbi:MAG: hypothetical protein M3332_06950 [Actinomycetota bacterium]|nr:hypothetical protein [Actinomycetota bacterium]
MDQPGDHSAVARDDVTAALPAPALAAVWCCSVGATWTVELHEFDCDAALGPIVDWISSGVPISEPEPTAALARELLTERGFQLIPDSSAGPSSLHRHGIGYACHDTDLITAGTRWFAAAHRSRHCDPVPRLAAQEMARGYNR